MGIVAFLIWTISGIAQVATDEGVAKSSSPAAVQQADDASHFRRLCKLRIAYHTRYAAIVQTIRDEATAQAAAKAYADVLPLKCAIHHLGRLLRNYELDSHEQTLLSETDQKIDSINSDIVRATLKVRDEPYFNLFGTVFNEMLVTSRAMRPFAISEGHAQRGDGPQFVIWLPAGAKPELDLSDVDGRLQVLVVDELTGELQPQRQYVNGGGKVVLQIPDSVDGGLYWLRPECRVISP